MADAYIGEIRMVGFPYAPMYWSNADGQTLAISEYTTLYALYGTIYGGDGRVNFNLPDLRGRVPIHEGQGPGLPPYQMGWPGGMTSVLLGTNEIPNHAHAAKANAKAADATEAAPTDHYWAQLVRGGTAYGTDHDVEMAPDTVELNPNGGTQAHENRPPYLTVRFCVCLDGMFPPRN